MVLAPLRLKAPPRKFLKLTEQEIQKRREKGLCFSCNEKFGPGHRCKKELNIILVEEEEYAQSKLKGEISAEDSADGDWSMVESSAIEASLFTAHVSARNSRERKCGRSREREREFTQKQIVYLFTMWAFYTVLWGKLKGHLQRLEISNRWSTFQRLVSSRWT